MKRGRPPKTGPSPRQLKGLPHRITQPECDRLRLLRQVHSIETCAQLLGRSEETVRRAIARDFQAYVDSRLRRRPKDFALLADTMTMLQLSRHYRTGLTTVRRWAKEIGRKDKWRGRPKLKVCPPDLRERVAELGLNGAQIHYGVSQGTFLRWREEAGLPVAHKRKTLARRASKFGWVDQIAVNARAKSRSTGGTYHV